MQTIQPAWAKVFQTFSQSSTPMTLDEITSKSGLAHDQVTSALSELEQQHVVTKSGATYAVNSSGDQTLIRELRDYNTATA